MKPVFKLGDSDATRDPRDLAAYGIPEAAHYLQIPAATLRSWVVGRPYPTRAGIRMFAPVIELPDRGNPSLSFFNLVEAHVLGALRRQHGIKLPRVRAAVRYLREKFRSRHPLADRSFETDGLDLFIEQTGLLIAVSGAGQIGIREVLEAHLRRIEWDPTGAAIRLFPFTRNGVSSEPKGIVIDPHVSFGRPALAGKGIPTAVIAERYKAGESVDSLTTDYECSRDEIEEAIRCELRLEAA